MITYDKYARYRDAKNLTDYKVSSLCGINQTTLSEWKSGKYTPKIDKLVKIAKVLDITVDVLIEETEDG